jgi:hypothetical protein
MGLRVLLKLFGCWRRPFRAFLFGKKEEGRRKKEEGKGRRKKEEGRRKKEEAIIARVSAIKKVSSTSK